MARFFSIIYIFFFSVGISFGQIDLGPEKGLVRDYAHLLNSSQEGRLEQKLKSFNDSTSIQIAFYSEESLDNNDDFNRALEIAENLGIGQKETNNGVLLYVAKKERKIRIITGYGVEHFLTDALSKRIIEEIITPQFKNGNFYTGIDKATSTMMKLGVGEYDGLPQNDGAPDWFIFLFIVFLVVIAMIIISNHDNGDGGGYHKGGRYIGHTGGGWTVIGGGGGSNSGGSGGFSGGGFGGFGGGSFGGGGAGGSW